jgi:putative spermidine/putrescine transport system permease protein
MKTWLTRTPAWEKLFYGMSALVLLFLVSPVFFVIPMSFNASRYLEFPPTGFSLQWYQEYFSRIAWQRATLISVEVALVTMLAATTLGTLAAFAMTRYEFRGKGAVTMFVFCPLVISPIITSLSLYVWFAKLRILGTVAALVLAHLVLTIPYVIIVVSAALRGFDRRLEFASLSLGAGPIRTFLRVTLPIILPGILTAGLFALAISFDEVIIAMFISGGGARTLPVRMWEGIMVELDPTMAAVSTLVIAVTLSIFLGASLLRRKR